MCPFVSLPVERGVAALVHGTAVAVFLTYDDKVYALGNHDPFSGRACFAGIVGTPWTTSLRRASPMHKQAFDLRTGSASTTPSTWSVVPGPVVDGIV